VSDPRVEAAITHWAPRYVEHGVPVGDFLDVTRSIGSWEDWCAAWTEAGAVHEELGDEALAQGYLLSAGDHYLTAAVEYHFGKFLFCHDIDQMQATHRKAVAAHRKAHPLVEPQMERIEFDYLGTHTLVGNLRKPTGIDHPPVVLLIPGLDSAKEELSGMEFWFLDRGMATFSIDGPGQGEAEYDLPIETAYEKPAGAAIDALEARDDIDVSRLGALGVSLGGYYVVRAAAFEKRIKAVISLSGPHTINDTIDVTPPMTQLAFQVRTHSPDFETAKQKLASMDLTGVAELVTCPSFIVTGANDRIVPADQTRRIAQAIAGPTHVQIIDDANHVATNKAYMYRPHMADWMADQLRARANERGAAV
jgi:2,6-dihydroxypseudooxynicotine hydrolase